MIGLNENAGARVACDQAIETAISRLRFRSQPWLMQTALVDGGQLGVVGPAGPGLTNVSIRDTSSEQQSGLVRSSDALPPSWVA